MAPPAMQDAKAAEWTTTILQNNGGDITAVPVAWYLGRVPSAGSAEWDRVPAPSAGNVLTPRQYQQKWVTTYNSIDDTTPAQSSAILEAPVGSCVGVIGAGGYGVGAAVDGLVASDISWGGYRNGQIPTDALRYSSTSSYLHPSASTAWDQLAADALAEGFDLRGAGYRPASAGGATAGRSNHGWGLAIDVSVLVPGQRYRTTAQAFESPEYAWLAANAAAYGWVNPAWAKPVSLGGNGKGGHVGDGCCFLEPWHWEWAAFLNTALPPG